MNTLTLCSAVEEANGRGIALSRQLSFSSLTYIPPGNRVVVTVPREQTSE